MDKNQQLVKVFEKYNEVFAQAYDRLLEEGCSFSGISADNNEETLRRAVADEIRTWHEEPIADDEATTGGDLIASIDSIDGAYELAEHAALYCDDDFPELVKQKVMSFGQPMADRLASHVLGDDFNLPMERLYEDGESLQVSAQVLRLLAEWEQTSLLENLTHKFASAETPNEMIADAIRYYLSAAGAMAIPVLSDIIGSEIDANGNLDLAGEYLLIALTDIGKNAPSDRMFQLLRKAFKAMGNKTIGAICIGDYGDGRGVATLKGWLNRHPEIDDRQMIGEILSSIKRLGGDIRDVQHRLKTDRGL